jgi:hypothetical protein
LTEIQRCDAERIGKQKWNFNRRRKKAEETEADNERLEKDLEEIKLQIEELKKILVILIKITL